MSVGHGKPSERFVYISPFVILLFLAACALGLTAKLALAYCAVLLHEAAHFFACVFLKEQVLKIRFMPYGLNLVTAFIRNPKHEMLISVCGPLANILLAAFCRQGFFQTANLVLFALNICPALPLDGGVFLKGALSLKCGYVRAVKKLLSVTRIFAVIFLFIGFVLLILSKYNISLLLIGLFLLYNIKYEKERLLYIKKKLLLKEFGVGKSPFCVRKMGITEEVKLVSLIQYFGYSYVLEVSVFDRGFQKRMELSQSDILSAIETFGAGVTAGRLLITNERDNLHEQGT